ncbi:MAG TPA: Rieske 2Fe-2S domain-containing protein, partial [Chloroflexota bacterium]|nr:Rieske 2Fe-2S domain-containing protein [Chloroflexota bacterium]
MAEYVVGRIDDLPQGSRRIVRAGRLEIGVFNVEGRYYALPNVCAHQFGPLCEGVITGTLVA